MDSLFSIDLSISSRYWLTWCVDMKSFDIPLRVAPIRTHFPSPLSPLTGSSGYESACGRTHASQEPLHRCQFNGRCSPGIAIPLQDRSQLVVRRAFLNSVLLYSVTKKLQWYWVYITRDTVTHMGSRSQSTDCYKFYNSFHLTDVIIRSKFCIDW